MTPLVALHHGTVAFSPTGLSFVRRAVSQIIVRRGTGRAVARLLSGSMAPAHEREEYPAHERGVANGGAD
jgi:hypothetical protein